MFFFYNYAIFYLTLQQQGFTQYMFLCNLLVFGRSIFFATDLSKERKVEGRERILHESNRWRWRPLTGTYCCTLHPDGEKRLAFSWDLRRMTISASTTSRTMLFVINCLLFDNGIEYRVSLVDVTLTCLNNPDCFDCSRLLSL